jgi:hypothetical protein
MGNTPGKKKRRIVKRKKTIPKIEDLKRIANSRGMTTKELVDYYCSMNADKTNYRNKSVSYDMGPYPWRKDDEDE